MKLVYLKTEDPNPAVNLVYEKTEDPNLAVNLVYVETGDLFPIESLGDKPSFNLKDPAPTNRNFLLNLEDK